MNLQLDRSLSVGYRSKSQIARVITENWVYRNMYCPRCGFTQIEQFENNQPVADFFCPECSNEYELKSKSGVLRAKINDGAYDAMISRITGNNNPDFFFMTYSGTTHRVSNFVLILKHFFVPDMIEKRNPLGPNARRAGWVGCNILIDKVPKQGRISIISDGEIIDRNSVLSQVHHGSNLEISDIKSRGWLMDILNCINRISTPVFTLNEVYKFENELQFKYPHNNHIRAKIRQQLQFLRDKGVIEFLGNGKYRKIM
ncbi:MAG: DpnI domain-containing protein [Christensenellales bacterium]